MICPTCALLEIEIGGYFFAAVKVSEYVQYLTFSGTPTEASMALHSTSWAYMAFHGTAMALSCGLSWHCHEGSMALAWAFMDVHGLSWHLMRLHAHSWAFMALSWKMCS